MTGKSRIWPVLLAAGLGLVVLLSLGAWQVQRLAWKERLLAQLAANAASGPVDLATAVKRHESGENVEFLRVNLSGSFAHASEATILTTYRGGPGFTIVTPFELGDGSAVLIDRGQVPEAGKAAIVRPDDDLELTGIVRLHREKRGFFDVQDENGVRAFYWWDVESIKRMANLPRATRWLPFVVQLLPGEAIATYPRPPEPWADLRNNHLGYAITWFGLAAVLVVISGLYIRGATRKSSA